MEKKSYLNLKKRYLLYSTDAVPIILLTWLITFDLYDLISRYFGGI